MPKYEEIEIRVDKKGEKDNKYWIKGNDGEFYGGFRDWEGTLTDGYQDFLGVVEGQSIVIEYSKSVGANDKIYRNVRSIHASSVQGTPQAQTPRTEPNTAPQGKPDKFWEQQAYEKCLSLWFSNSGDKAEAFINAMNTGIYWDLFQAIKADGKKRFFDFGKGSDEVLAEHLPTIQQEQACIVCGTIGATTNDGLHECIPF